MARFGWVRVLLAAGACWLGAGGNAHACVQLPPGLRANVQAINLDSPVPANGALMFRLDCFHDCTPCTALEQRLDITVTDAKGNVVRGEKPEQVLLSEDALRHLVLWRPAMQPVPGDYEVVVGVRGQEAPQTLPLTLAEAAPTPDLSELLVTELSSYRVERGTLYSCDQSMSDCDLSGRQFGERYAMFPALDVRVSESQSPLFGQLLFHVMHQASDGTTHWGSWQPAGLERLEQTEPLSEYCAEVEVRSLLPDSSVIRETRCEPNADLSPPAEIDTDISANLEICLRPPGGLEPEWCELHASNCSALSYVSCSEIERWCAEPIRRGSTTQAHDPPVSPSIEPAELCAAPGDPYNAGVKGCGCRASSARGPGVASTLLLLLLTLVPRLRRRAARQAKAA